MYNISVYQHIFFTINTAFYITILKDRRNIKVYANNDI